MKKSKVVAYLFVASIVLWFAADSFSAAKKAEAKVGKRTTEIEKLLNEMGK
jgi:hypothetical protein